MPYNLCKWPFLAIIKRGTSHNSSASVAMLTMVSYDGCNMKYAATG